jgi:protein phosphatase
VTAIGVNTTGHTVRDSGSGATVTVSWAVATDVGLHRAANEDSFVAASPVFAVADGMGGHSAGDIASGLVVSRLAELQSDGFATVSDVQPALERAVTDLEAQVTDAQRSAGTTVTGAALVLADEGLEWAVFNIGDSRVYGLVNGTLEQLTRDHSVVQQLVDAGSITRDEADIHPHANVITRAVGLMEPPVPEFSTFPVVPASRLLLCSDGLTKEITDVGIEHFLVSTATAEEAANELLKNALGNSGRDNITVIVIDVLAVTPPGQTG